MDVKSEPTAGTLITKQRQSQWEMASKARKERRRRTKLRIAKRKRGD